MLYWLDTEFLDRRTIDPISIAVVAEDGRELYRQNLGCGFHKADDWIRKNVFPHLHGFSRAAGVVSPSCLRVPGSRSKTRHDCPWATRRDIAHDLREFCDPFSYGAP